MVSTVEFIYNQQSRSQVTPLCLVFMGGSHLMPFLCTPSITNLQNYAQVYAQTANTDENSWHMWTQHQLLPCKKLPVATRML